MLTSEQIAQLSDDARTQLFDRLAASVYRTQAEICAALGVSSTKTLQNWRRDGVPIMAVLAMQSIASAPDQPSALVQDARQIAGRIESISRDLAQLADIMASVVRRLPDPS